MNLNSKGYTLQELNNFFTNKRYSQKTKSIIIDLFTNKIIPSVVAQKYKISPQRINNIKNSFLQDYNEDTIVLFEGTIEFNELQELQKFAKKCKYLKIINNKTPSRKVYL